MDNLGTWMNDLLTGWGISPSAANVFDEMIIAVLMLGVAVCLNYAC